MTGSGKLGAALVVALAVAAGMRARADDGAMVDPLERERAIERSYEDEIARRSYLQYVHLDARVAGRTLTLVGRTGSELERALVDLMAHNEPGIGRVRDQLTIDETLPHWRAGAAENRRTRARNVVHRIQGDPELSVFTTIHTFVDGPRILLRGEVTEEAQRLRAEALAHEVAREVLDQIVVTPDAARSAPLPEPDEASRRLQRELDVLLAAEPLLAGSRLATRVRDRTITLIGTAPRLIEQDYALELIRSHLEKVLRADDAALDAPPGPLARRLADESAPFDEDTAEVPNPPQADFVVSSRAIIELEEPKAVDVKTE